MHTLAVYIHYDDGHKTEEQDVELNTHMHNTVCLITSGQLCMYTTLYMYKYIYSVSIFIVIVCMYMYIHVCTRIPNPGTKQHCISLFTSFGYVH